jgi:hypothetical protein
MGIFLWQLTFDIGPVHPWINLVLVSRKVAKQRRQKWTLYDLPLFYSLAIDINLKPVIKMRLASLWTRKYLVLCNVKLGCPRNEKKIFSVRTETNRNKICFAFVSVCFVKPKNIFFGLFRYFEPISKQPKQTDLFRNEPKQSGIFWKIPKYALYTVKKRFESFPSPAGMSLPNSPWAGIMTS